MMHTYSPRPGDSWWMRHVVLRLCCLVGWTAGVTTRRWSRWRARRQFARQTRAQIRWGVQYIENTYHPDGPAWPHR